LFKIARRLQRTWHLWGAAVSVIFLAVMMVLSPVLIAPLFNKYTALDKPEVVSPILRLARANGITADKVYEMDASRQTTRVSANVSGFLGTMRITLNDNLLKRCSLGEIEAVMGHEMGHYVLNHIYKGLLFFGVVIVIGFAWLRWSLTRALARFGAKWQISDIGDPAVTPLVVLLFSSYLFVLTPITNTFVRSQEMEADMFGLNAARQPDGAAEVALKLGEYRKLQPGPIEEWVFFDHPSGATRIRAAMRWKAENLDQQTAIRNP
jgi:STE24 endopeptidase